MIGAPGTRQAGAAFGVVTIREDIEVGEDPVTLVSPDLLDEAAHAPHFTIAEAALVMPTVASSDTGAQGVVSHAVILPLVSDYQAGPTRRIPNAAVTARRGWGR